jgi:hypothetical protein
MNVYQQGDVLLKSVDQVPAGTTREPLAVLAEGEATGHRHLALGEGVTIESLPPVRYLRVPKGAVVVHPEHKTLKIPPGNYQIDRVREYDHFTEEKRIVRD